MTQNIRHSRRLVWYPSKIGSSLINEPNIQLYPNPRLIWYSVFLNVMSTSLNKLVLLLRYMCQGLTFYCVYLDFLLCLFKLMIFSLDFISLWCSIIWIVNFTQVQKSIWGNTWIHSKFILSQEYNCVENYCSMFTARITGKSSFLSTALKKQELKGKKTNLAPIIWSWGRPHPPTTNSKNSCLKTCWNNLKEIIDLPPCLTSVRHF